MKPKADVSAAQMFPTHGTFCLLKKIQFSLESYHLLFVPEASEAQGQVEHSGGVERAAGKLQRLRRKKQKNYSAANKKRRKRKERSPASISGSNRTSRIPPSITDLFLGSAVQHHWGPHNALVPLVKVAILGTAEVSQDKDCLEVRVVLVSKLLDSVSGDAGGGVDILRVDGGRKIG